MRAATFLRFMLRLDRLAGRLTESLVIASGWLLVLLALTVSLEVVLRKAFRHSLLGVDEVGGYLLAIIATVSFAIAAHQCRHIRMDVLVRTYGRGLQVISALVALITLALFAAVLVFQSGSVLLESIDYSAVSATPLRLPLIYPQGAWFGGMLFFLMIIFIRLVLIIAGLLAKDTASVDRGLGLARAPVQRADDV